MRANPRIVLTLLALALAGSQSMASSHDRGHVVEITPTFGQRLAGGFNDVTTGADFELDETSTRGFIIGIFVDENSLVEIVYSHQETRLEEDEGLFSSAPLFDLDVDYFHIGGIYQLDGKRARPFFAATLGVTRLDPEQGGFDSETGFSLAMGGGVKIQVHEHVGFRFEGRGYFTFLDTGGELFCSDGQCFVRVESSGMWQADFSVGLVLSF